jgi:hypothetical protein
MQLPSIGLHGWGSLDFPNNPHQRRVESEGLLVIVHSRCVLPGRMTIFFTSSLRSTLEVEIGGSTPHPSRSDSGVAPLCRVSPEPARRLAPVANPPTR